MIAGYFIVDLPKAVLAHFAKTILPGTRSDSNIYKTNKRTTAIQHSTYITYSTAKCNKVIAIACKLGDSASTQSRV